MSLNLVSIGSQTLLFEEGCINGPFSIYLNERFFNPHTREVIAGALRVLHCFLKAFEIDLPARALEGECLKSVERKWLAALAYRPIAEIERMNAVLIRRLVTANKSVDASKTKGAVEPNTAAKRLKIISAFLDWYKKTILNEAIRPLNIQARLSENYSHTCMTLAESIGGTKQGHHHQIRSLPIQRYLQIIREVYKNPETVFNLNTNKSSRTIKRDKAIVLLAAEGLRPGSIGNLTIDDFIYKPGDSHGYVVLKDNILRRSAPVTTATPTVKGIRSRLSGYRSEITIRIWGFTCAAINDYIVSEREEILVQNLNNRSRGFLFLAEHGGPFENRTSITHVFRSLRTTLKKLGLLNKVEGDPFVRSTYYNFTAYTLRHSAATFFYFEKQKQPDVKDQMRLRFGWSTLSSQPDRYANRAMSEAASVDMENFQESLMRDVLEKRLFPLIVDKLKAKHEIF